MAQPKHRIENVNMPLVSAVMGEKATGYYLAMSFQFGCSIGELIAMGIPPEKLRESFEKILEVAVETRIQGAVKLNG